MIKVCVLFWTIFTLATRSIGEMASNRYGNVGEFDQATENWTAYIERMEQYFVANDVTANNKKRAILLSTCGPTTYSLIRSLVAPSKVTDIEYPALLEKINKHFNPRPSIIMERYKFHSRTQQPEESVSAFIAELRKLTEFCDFGDSVNDMLRDRFVAGLSNTRIQHRLLAESTLTFQKAQSIAQAMELAEKDVQTMQSTTDVQAPVHTVAAQPQVTRKSSGADVQPPPPGGQYPRPCYRCGGKHSHITCYFKTAQCHNCGKTGHISRVCRSKGQPRP